MKFSRQIKPISYLKAHAAEIARGADGNADPLVITQNGEARLVVQGIESYERTQETLALLKMLALGSQQVGEGRVHEADQVIAQLRERSRD